MKFGLVHHAATVCVLVVLSNAVGVQLFAQEEEVEASRQYGIAVELQKLESYDLAAEAWDKFLQQYPGDPRIGKATHYLGVCRFQEGQFDEALAAFQKVLKSHPDLELLDQSYLYLGVTQYRMGESGKPESYDSAAESFNRLLSKFPESKYVPDALFYRGECLYLRDKRQEAIPMYQRLLGKHPGHRFRPDALYAMGVAQEESSQEDAAGKSYEAFLQQYPNHELAHEVGMRLGETLFVSGKYPAAAARFQAAAAAPGFEYADWATIRHADALAQAAKYAEAAAVYASVAGDFPESEHLARAVLAGGKCYYLAGGYAEARKQLQPALDAGGPGALEAAHWTAKSFLKEGQPAEALATVEKVLPKAHRTELSAQLLMDRADAMYEISGRRAESIDLYAEIAHKHPGDALAPQALYMAAYSALQEGQHGRSFKHAAAFLASHTDHELAPDVMHLAAESQLLLKEYPDAEQRYAELVQKHPDRPDSGLWKVRHALVLQLQEKHQETIAALESVLKQLGKPSLIAEAQHVIGTSHLACGRYKEAAESLRAALAADDQWRQADETRLALARAYRNLDKLDQAKEAVGELIRQFPESRILDQAYYRLGEYHYVAGDYTSAADAYQKVIDNWPQSALVPHALHETACARFSAGSAQVALSTLSRLIQEYPDHNLTAGAYYARAMARHQLKQYDAAVKDLETMLATGPAGRQKSDARYLLGLCQLGSKQYADAAATFRNLMKEDPQYAGADNTQYQLAWALKLEGKAAEAAEAFATLAKAFPKSSRVAEAYYHVGEAAYEGKQYHAAAKAYYQAMQVAGKSELGEKGAHKLGWSYYHQENYDSAQKAFSYQRKTYPEGPLAADGEFMEAECLFKQEKHAEALAAYEGIQGLKSQDFQVLALLHAGQAAGQLKQWQKSLQRLADCTDRFPKSPYADQALYEQGWAQQNLGKPDQAVALYEKVIATSGASGSETAARAQFMIGEIQFEKKIHNEAVKSFFKVIYGYSHPKWQAEATYEAARCFEVLKKPTQAVKLYEELVEKYPESDKEPLARERIKELKS